MNSNAVIRPAKNSRRIWQPMFPPIEPDLPPPARPNRAPPRIMFIPPPPPPRRSRLWRYLAAVAVDGVIFTAFDCILAGPRIVKLLSIRSCIFWASRISMACIFSFARWGMWRNMSFLRLLLAYFCLSSSRRYAPTMVVSVRIARRFDLCLYRRISSNIRAGASRIGARRDARHGQRRRRPVDTRRRRKLRRPNPASLIRSRVR